MRRFTTLADADAIDHDTGALQPLGRRDGVGPRHVLAIGEQNDAPDVAIGVEITRNLVYRAAWMKDQRQPYGYYSAMAKLFASETASKCANHALQVFGGYGYCQDYPAERLLRDAKITELYEGTSEIHRLVIFRGLLNEAQNGWMAKV